MEETLDLLYRKEYLIVWIVNFLHALQLFFLAASHFIFCLRGNSTAKYLQVNNRY